MNVNDIPINLTITGSSGFVGQNLIKYLDGFNISSLSVRYHPEQVIKLKPKVEAIIHLAGKAHDLKKVSIPRDYYDANFELTKKLYDAFLVSNAKKFIFISSVKAVTDSASGILNENFIPNPQTHYGRSKLQAEEYIRSHSLPEGKSYYILRPCMIHGPGNKGNLNLLYSLVAKGVPYPLASYSNRRSFLSVENLCFVIKEILDRDNIASGIYNVADDEPLSTNEVVTLLAQAQDKNPRLFRVPKVIIEGIAKLGDTLHLPLTSERLQKLTENFVVSNKKIKVALNNGLPVTSREGILKTARSFRRQQ